MYVKRKEEINWVAALEVLSPVAYYLLSTIWYKDINISDANLKKHIKVGESTYRKKKKELVDNGYLTSDQVNRCKFQYTVGDNV